MIASARHSKRGLHMNIFIQKFTSLTAQLFLQMYKSIANVRLEFLNREQMQCILERYRL